MFPKIKIIIPKCNLALYVAFAYFIVDTDTIVPASASIFIRLFCLIFGVNAHISHQFNFFFHNVTL